MSLARWCDLGLNIVLIWNDHLWLVNLAWIRVHKSSCTCEIASIDQVLRMHDEYNLDEDEIEKLVSYTGRHKLAAVLNDRIGRLVTAANRRDER